MDTILQHLTWEETQKVSRAREALKATRAALEAAVAADAEATRTLTYATLLLEARKAHIMKEFRLVPVSAIPPRGTLVYYVDSFITDITQDNLDPDGFARRVIIRDPAFGYVVRFTVAEPGPRLSVQSSGLPRVCAGMRARSTLTDYDPLYNVGTILEYHGDGPAPELAPGAVFTVDSASFPADSSAELKIVKSSSNIELDLEDMEQDTATHSTIIVSRPGIPRRNTHMTVRNPNVTLVPITGQVISIEPRCSMATWLPASALTLDDARDAGVTSYTVAANLVQPSYEVKSAVRKQ